MKNYSTCLESIFLMYLDAEHLSVNGFIYVKKWSKVNDERSSTDDFVKYCDENSSKGCILEIDVEYPQKLFNLHSDFERKKIENCNKFACNIHDKKITMLFP